MENNLIKLGTGWVKDPIDERDFAFSAHPEYPIARAAVDFGIPFSVQEPPNENQDGSSSCVSQAWSYYHWQLTRMDYSRRDLYSWIFLEPGGGAYIRDGGIRIVKIGQQTRNECPDPNPETETAMRVKSGLPDSAGNDDREADAYIVGASIDDYAATIKAFKGCVGGLNGSFRDGWENLAEPNPPKSLGADWGHALYFIGYHMHSDGQKCVIAKSSWGTAGNTTVHHIRENYFKDGYVFNAWTLIPRRRNNMFGIKKVGDPTVYVLVGNKLIPIADWQAFVVLGGSNESIVELSEEQFAKFQVINSVLFKLT